MTMLSKYFSLAEMTKSQTATRLGLDNIPSDGSITVYPSPLVLATEARNLTRPLDQPRRASIAPGRLPTLRSRVYPTSVWLGGFGYTLILTS